ncbi:L,D-transpeptidase [Actinomadura rupiterrae]|uniref:L,D-transpeptidase n=1 Tax=Actinomadura rupiterrae TaxID=559627 RepID=UPI0020A58BE3|nr:Ig-like domain-containing protein [Actinomadura rupiterrae]MCP2341255.1 lipoprotein-anchoring transpeptidase ErfK/SrfK [Actinomadura rupiterrae]
MDKVRTGAAVLVAALALVAGCSSGGGGGKGDGGHKGAAPPPTITPANGTQQVAPEQPVQVKATAGRLSDVTVTDAKGHKAEGKLSPDGRSWQTSWGLTPGASYTVTAHGKDGDKQSTATSTFTTVAAKQKLESGLSPLDGENVGVGMPVQLLLSDEVPSKAGKQAVERALELRASTPITGAWSWVNDKEVDFRPKDYWPSGTKVKLVAHLAGVKAGDGLYGVKDRTLSFTIGAKHYTRISAESHEAKVYNADRVVRTMPVSLGRPGDDSYTGVMIAQEKDAHIIMDSATTGDPGAYKIPTEWNVRMTYSGTFVHAAPWSTGAQGNSNVSHGCVNASPEDAKWFFNFTNRGDIIEVTGTSRKLRFGNGPTPWAKSWDAWLQDSALGQPVTTSPL